ncbi:ubiquinol-cytochrome c reductase iron-sulfur subunit [Bacteroidota bacterium]
MKLKITRRKFFDTLLAFSGLGIIIAIIYPVIAYLIPPKSAEAKVSSIKAGSASEFPINSSEIIKFGRNPVILIKSESGDFKAFDATCTHLDCIVQYRTDLMQIWCACHNGIYDLNGKNVSGPPPKPLSEYFVKVINDEIIISAKV